MTWSDSFFPSFVPMTAGIRNRTRSCGVSLSEGEHWNHAEKDAPRSDPPAHVSHIVTREKRLFLSPHLASRPRFLFSFFITFDQHPSLQLRTSGPCPSPPRPQYKSSIEISHDGGLAGIPSLPKISYHHISGTHLVRLLYALQRSFQTLLQSPLCNSWSKARSTERVVPDVL